MTGGTTRAVPYGCPFCGEEDLRPAEHDGAPVWHCRGCLRLFSVTFHGLAPAEASTVAPPASLEHRSVEHRSAEHRSADWSDH